MARSRFARNASAAARLAALVGICSTLLIGTPWLSGCMTSSSVVLSGDGKTATIPADVPQLGGYTVTCYEDFDGKWAYAQGDVYDEWESKGKVYDDGIATIDGLYLVACSETFGSVGDKVKFRLEDGTEIDCMIADIKSSGDSNYSMWGHLYGGKVSVIEFEVQRSAYEARGNPGQGGWKPEWGGKAVNSCTNYGSGLNVGAGASSGGIPSCSVPQAGGSGYLTTASEIAADDSHGYKMGAMGPDEFDCQGFVKYCLKQNGWDISPWTFKDGRGTAAAVDGLTKMGWTVSRYDESALQAGDVLIWDKPSGGHVAFCAGDGFVIDAQNDHDGMPGDGGGKEIARRKNTYTDWEYFARPPAGSAVGSAGDGSGGIAGCSAAGVF